AGGRLLRADRRHQLGPISLILLSVRAHSAGRLLLFCRTRRTYLRWRLWAAVAPLRADGRLADRRARGHGGRGPWHEFQARDQRESARTGSKSVLGAYRGWRRQFRADHALRI